LRHNKPWLAKWLLKAVCVVVAVYGLVEAWEIWG
jgi:hypothetical protein